MSEALDTQALDTHAFDAQALDTQAIELTIALCRRASVTPDDAGCQTLLAERLAAADFQIERIDAGEVRNLWATHGHGEPVLALVGHTDVVPPGPLDAWTTPPFEPSVRDGRLYARGAADMKGSVAAMTLALADFVAANPAHRGTVALLVTSDEEGPALDGIRHVADAFERRGQRIDWCVVGEPSSRQRLGDQIRIGRRGSLSGRLTVRGIQGHVAYAELALNPIHALAPALAELAGIEWDRGNADFPPTGFQVSNIQAGTGVGNVIPGCLSMDFNFRYAPASSAAGLKAAVESLLDRHRLDYTVQWTLSGEPFHTPEGPLRRAVVQTIEARMGLTPEANAGGGTSDGRFLAPLGAQVVELGPINASIHQIDEYVALADLGKLRLLYRELLQRLLG